MKQEDIVVAILERTDKILAGPNDWTQGLWTRPYVAEDGMLKHAHCLTGALTKAKMDMQETGISIKELSTARDKAHDTICKVIGRPLTNWNDLGSRTFPEVKDALAKSIEAAKAGQSTAA